MNLQVLEEYKGMCPVQAKVLFKWFRGYPSKYKLFQQPCNRFRLGWEIEHKWYFCLTETQLQPSAEPPSVLSLEELEMFYNSSAHRVSEYVLKIPLTLFEIPKWMVPPI